MNRVLVFAGILICASVGWSDEPPSPEQIKFFETKVRPVLVEKCQSCHGAEKQKSGLRVDSRDALLTGGESGPAIDTDAFDKSLLLEAIRYEMLQMPPDRKLPAEEIKALTEWVKQGAPWPVKKQK